MLHETLTNKQYHKLPGLSASGLKEFMISPAHYIEYRCREFNADVKLESLVHLFMLEPHNFDSQYVVINELRSNADKARYAEAVAEGKLRVRDQDISAAMNISENAMSDPFIANLFTRGKNEHSIFCKDKDLGIELKIRPDTIIEETNTIIDIKTISRGKNDFGLQSLIRTRQWDIQAAFYLYVANQVYGQNFDFIHCFIEDAPPYGVRLRRINKQSIENAMKEILPHLVDYKECLETNKWPKYTNEIKSLNIIKYNNEETISEELF